MSVQASAPAELRGALGRDSYHRTASETTDQKASFVRKQSSKLLWGSQLGLASLECLIDALSVMH